MLSEISVEVYHPDLGMGEIEVVQYRKGRILAAVVDENYLKRPPMSRITGYRLSKRAGSDSSSL